MAISVRWVEVGGAWRLVPPALLGGQAGGVVLFAHSPLARALTRVEAFPPSVVSSESQFVMHGHCELQL